MCVCVCNNSIIYCNNNVIYIYIYHKAIQDALNG